MMVTPKVKDETVNDDDDDFDSISYEDEVE